MSWWGVAGSEGMKSPCCLPSTPRSPSRSSRRCTPDRSTWCGEADDAAGCQGVVGARVGGATRIRSPIAGAGAARPQGVSVDGVHADGVVPRTCLHVMGRLGVIPGAHRPGDPQLRAEPVFDVIDAARSRGCVVVDTGAWPDGVEIVKAATDAIVVIDGSPLGIVRAAGVIAEWTGPPPVVVVNRVPRAQREDVRTAVRRWTGLEPVVLLPPISRVPATARKI